MDFMSPPLSTVSPPWWSSTFISLRVEKGVKNEFSRTTGVSSLAWATWIPVKKKNSLRNLQISQTSNSFRKEYISLPAFIFSAATISFRGRLIINIKSFTLFCLADGLVRSQVLLCSQGYDNSCSWQAAHWTWQQCNHWVGYGEFRWTLSECLEFFLPVTYHRPLDSKTRRLQQPDFLNTK